MSSETSVPPAGVIRRLGASAPVAIVLSVFPPLGGFALLAFLTQLGPWLRLHYDVGWLIYFLAIGLLIGVSFIPTFSGGILAGWAFGVTAGWPLSVVTITAGALLAYAIGRGIARDRVLAVIQERPKLKALHECLLARRGAETRLVVTLVRIPPASPFALTNFVFAAAKVPLSDYTTGTLIGILPRMALTTYVGAGLEQLRFENVFATWMTVAGLVVAVLVCVALGFLADRALRRMMVSS